MQVVSIIKFNHFFRPETAVIMALTSRQTPLLLIDDLHVTGILRERFDYILYDYKMHIFCEINAIKIEAVMK